MHAEPPDHAAADPLGEGGQISLRDWPRRQERRRGVAPCIGSRRSKDAVGHACVQVHGAMGRSEAGYREDAQARLIFLECEE